ncbi:unnamed protein product, partial [Iphiclides podalirius]
MKRFIISVCCVFYYVKILRCSSYEEVEDDYMVNKYYNDEVSSFERNDDMVPDIYLLKGNYQRLKEDNPQEQYSAEKKAGDITDLIGINVHYRQPNIYDDLGRRFMFHNYGSQKRRNTMDTIEDRLTPVKAPPEFVLAVAKESAKLQAANPIHDTDEIIRKKVLRSGDYWDSVWVENVKDPDKILRSRNDENLPPKLATVKANIMPGSKLYRLISVLKQISPRLIYVINTAKDN